MTLILRLQLAEACKDTRDDLAKECVIGCDSYLKDAAYVSLLQLSFTSAAMDQAAAGTRRRPEIIPDDYGIIAEGSEKNKSLNPDPNEENDDFYEFYMGRKTTCKPGVNEKLFSIYDIVSDGFGLRYFTDEHYFIQWVFPNPSMPRMHKDATLHVLTQKQTEKMKNNIRIMALIHLVLFKVLNFWGIYWQKDKYGKDQIKIYDSNFTWSFSNEHGNQGARFTRMLKFLKCMKMDTLANKLMASVLEYTEKKNPLDVSKLSCIVQWKNAVEYKPPWDRSNDFATASVAATATAAAAAAAGAAYFLYHRDPPPQAAAGRSIQRHKAIEQKVQHH